MTKFILGLGLLAMACGGSDGEQLQCAKSDRTGAYVAHFVERAKGSCGPVADTVLRFDSSGSLPAGCSFDAPDTWSADQCKLDRSYSCPVEGTTNTVSVVASSHQADSAGDKITAVETVTVYDATHSFLCTSTYDLTATRQ